MLEIFPKLTEEKEAAYGGSKKMSGEQISEHADLEFIA